MSSSNIVFKMRLQSINNTAGNDNGGEKLNLLINLIIESFHFFLPKTVKDHLSKKHTSQL